MFLIRLLAVVGAALSMLIGNTAYAYCVATTCSNTPAHENASDMGVVCNQIRDPDCGKIIFWKNPCFAYSLHQKGSAHFDMEKLRDAVRAAFEQWTLPQWCGNGITKKSPGLKVQNWTDVSCDQAEYNKNKGNANVIIFRDSGWAYNPEWPSMSRLDYDLDTGELLDADMEINTDPNNFTFSLDKVDPDKWDLPTVLLHEVGHFIGLADSEDSSAVMYHTLAKGVSKRVLSNDDIKAVCALYPPGIEAQCNPMPRHGFAKECANLQPKNDCSVRTPMPGGLSQHAVGWTAVCAALFVARAMFQSRSNKENTSKN